MICQWSMTSSDPYLHECLEGLPGILSAYRIEFEYATGRHWYLVGATGLAPDQAAWSTLCQCAIDDAEAQKDRISWMVDELELEGI